MDRNSLRERIRNQLQESAELKRFVGESLADLVLEAAEGIVACFRAGGKLMLCGNGGSAADCQHIAAEFMGRLSPQLERPPMPAITLSRDAPFLTAAGNDYGFEHVFERQIKAMGKGGDVLIVLSTSGDSPNTIKAVQAAKEQGIRTIALLGSTGGKLKGEVDLAIIVPSSNPQRVQEAQITMGHILCDLVEQTIYGEGLTR